jgi:hypothetical protein
VNSLLAIEKMKQEIEKKKSHDEKKEGYVRPVKNIVRLSFRGSRHIKYICFLF